jgi:hypothetical protein
MTEVDLKQVASGQAGDFDPEQKRYLEGFVAGVQIAKAAKSVAGAATAAPPGAAPTLPDCARKTARSPPAASSPIRRNSSASSIPSTPMNG